MKSLGIRQALVALLAFAVSALTPRRVPRTPAIIRFNEQPFAKRCYGKVIAGGHGAIDTIIGCVRGLLGAAQCALAIVKPAAVIAALVAVMLALDAGSSSDAVLQATPALAFSSKSLREAKGRLVAQSRTVIEAATAAEAAAPDSEKDAARANTERAKTEARTFLDQAAALDTDIALAEAQESHEAELGRSLGRRAGGQDTDPNAPAGEDPQDDFSALSVDQRGLVAGRMIRALAAGKGDVDRACKHAAKSWGEDDLAFRALSASDEVSGGAVVPDSIAAAVIELLRPMSAVRRLNPTVVPMGNGTLRLPKLAGGAAASYIGENDNAPKTEQTFGQLVMTFKKLAALVPVSNDLLRYAAPSVDQLVRDDVSSALGQTSDGKFIRGAGSEHAPRGMRYFAPAANVITANATVNLTNVTTDLGLLMLALENANVRMLRPGWVFAPRIKHYLMTVRDGNGNYAFRAEMQEGRLWGFPFATTTQVPTNLGGGTESEVYFADFADVIIGEALNLMIDASTEATYHDGVNLQSAFGRDQTVVRALQEHDFGMRHEESVAVLTAVTWGV